MKILKKFWGVALVIIMLTTMFIGTAAPAAAADYSLSDTYLGPYSVAYGGVLSPLNTAGFGMDDVAQSGTTMYAVGGNNTGTTTGNYLYKSVDAGATWTAITTSITTASGFNLVAVATDNPDIVAIVDNTATPNIVYLSTTGGTYFSALNSAAIGAGTINSVSISSLSYYRYLTISGTLGIATWKLGVAAPTWTVDTTRGPVYAVKYSPNFAADAGLIVVANSVTTNATTLQVYSTNLLTWNPTGYGYPETIAYSATTNVTTINKATITLDDNFYLGDDSTQIGFIGISGTKGATSISGVYRFDVTSAGYCAQIFSTTGVNSIAWDGTNLMVAPYDTAAGGALTIYRSANALATASSVSFLTSSTFKTPGTGTLPVVMFNSGVGYAFSRGTNSAVASTTDYGKTFNGIALVNSNFNTVRDYYISTDGSRIYAVVGDGTDLNVWRYESYAWQRVFVLAGGTAGTWEIRADKNNADTVFIGLKGNTTMYKSLDGGATWTTRACAVAIQDFVVQDSSTLYVAPSTVAGYVYKSTNGAFTWTGYATALSTTLGYSLTLVADDQLILGGKNGYVQYSTDAAATWSYIVYSLSSTTNIIAVATDLTSGIVYASASGATANSIASWTLGSSTAWAYASTTANVTGMTINNGVIYAFNDSANLMYRFLIPAYTATYGLSDTIACPAASIAQTGSILNTLQSSNGSNKIWAVNAGTPNNFVSYTDSLIAATDAPVPTYPINGATIDINSISGGVNNFVFQWNTPPVLSNTPLQDYTYDISVYLDEAGTILMGSASNVAPYHYGGSMANYAASSIVGLSLIPGETYYWKVRTDTPVKSYYSALNSFSIQQLTAIVPTLSSPANGASITAGMAPAFSWNPIANATSYKFQVSTDPAFATTIYDTTTASAGAAIPSTVKLVAGTNYFWRVKTLTPAEGDWSAVSNFSIAAPVVTTTAAAQVTPTITVVLPTATSTVITIPPNTTTTTEVNPSYIWAIIIIGAVLVIAVIVLIVRTRRSV
jgi:hypothetical protein